MIEAQQLAKHFGPVVAVRGVSLEAADGRITGLLGPNGAGKSTTLRMLYTVLRPDRGDALIDGHSAVRKPLAARACLGVLPHGAGIYPNLTARENILYFGALQGLPRRGTPRPCRRARQAPRDGGIRRPARRVASRRASGCVRRSRARSCIVPRNLVLDEPTNGLDVMAVRALRRLLLQLRDAGHCVLFSSHVMQEVSALCDELVVIAQGVVLEHGTPEQIRARTGAASLEEAFVRLIAATDR